MSMESKKSAIEIAFAVDGNTEECAYVAIHSMLLHSSRPVRIIVMHPDGENVICRDWAEKLSGLGRGADLLVASVDVSKFRHCKNLYDSHAGYLKIYAPRFATSSKMICSDVDVIFTDDVARLADLELGETIIARNGGEPCESRGETERQILSLCGKKPEDRYYGSGLSVIDVEAYRKHKKEEIAEEISEKYGYALKYHEQTVWNCIFSEQESMGIDSKWCQTPSVAKNAGQFQTAAGIIHFAGSPKPWDLFGEFAHPSFTLWIDAANKAGVDTRHWTKYFQYTAWKRAWRIRKQYKQCGWKVPAL